MKKQLSRLLRIKMLVMFLLTYQTFVMAQFVAFAQPKSSKTEIENSKTGAKRLKDVLNSLSNQYKVNILFDETIVQNILINQDLN